MSDEETRPFSASTRSKNLPERVSLLEHRTGTMEVQIHRMEKTQNAHLKEEVEDALSRTKAMATLTAGITAVQSWIERHEQYHENHANATRSWKQSLLPVAVTVFLSVGGALIGMYAMLQSLAGRI